MDLNYLYHRHQLSLMLADAAACAGSRHAHQAFARGYAHRIQTERDLHEGEGPAALAKG